MPRTYTQAPTGGTATTGKAYEPAVTPNRRDGDDTAVIGGRNAGVDTRPHGEFGPDSEKEGRRVEKTATPRTDAERKLDDVTRYDEDGRKDDRKTDPKTKH